MRQLEAGIANDEQTEKSVWERVSSMLAGWGIRQEIERVRCFRTSAAR